jgi:hypothetical protein
MVAGSEAATSGPVILLCSFDCGAGWTLDWAVVERARSPMARAIAANRHNAILQACLRDFISGSFSIHEVRGGCGFVSGWTGKTEELARRCSSDGTTRLKNGVEYVLIHGRKQGFSKILMATTKCLFSGDIQ